MNKNMFQKVLCMILSVTLLLTSMGFTVSAANHKETSGVENPYVETTLEDMKQLAGTVPYAEYIQSQAGKKPGSGNIVIDVVADLNSEETDAAVFTPNQSQAVKDAKDAEPGNWTAFDFGKFGDTTLYLPATGKVAWNFNVEENQVGLYYIKIEYFTCTTAESSVSAIERGLRIGGRIPFSEVASITLDKNWAFDYFDTVVTDMPAGTPDSYDIDYYYDDDYLEYSGSDKKAYIKVVTSVVNCKKTVTTYTMRQDLIGNSMAPSAEAAPTWNTAYLQDDTGYYSGYFAFGLDYGHSTFTLEAERDPVIIKSITFEPAVESAAAKSYADYLKGFESLGAKAPSNGQIIKIEAEFPDMVSDSSVAPSNDNSSPATYPIISGTQLYNAIGETGFSAVGQWAAYKFRVTESGFYNFGMRFKQNALQGMFACRTLKLAGGDYGETPAVPFAEAYNVKFAYVDDWQSSYLTDGVNGPFRFYFEEGKEYTMYLECSLGTLKEQIQKAEAALNEVNAAYLKIIQLTGTDPDEYNDTYDFMQVMPDVPYVIQLHAKSLKGVHEYLKEECGTNGAHIATLETIYNLFHKTSADNGDNIASNLSNLKSYLGTLGTWINDSKASTVIIDSIVVAPMKLDKDGKLVEDNNALPKVKANFFQSMWFEIVAFFSSFAIDYDQMGVTVKTEKKAEHIDVWIAAGRDQANIWRTMIDAQGGFTDRTGVSVALKLVAGGTLLPSILSRKGPDVYLGLGSSEVINYAIRSAVLGVNGLDPRLTDEQNAVFNSTLYTYKDGDTYTTQSTPKAGVEASFVMRPFSEVTDQKYFAKAAMDTIMISPGVERDKDGNVVRALPAVAYGVPRTMQFAMMFYRMDILADLNLTVPETWDDLLSILPILQSNNMQIGVSYVQALDYMIYQEGGSMWKYTDESKYDAAYAGAAVDLDSNIALRAFDFTCRLYSDYSFPVSFDAANRFRTGEMPLLLGSYADLYNQLVVYATEISGLWEFCSLPGSYMRDENEDFKLDENGKKIFNYNSLATVTSTILLSGCEKRGNLRPAWQFVQWETAAEQSAEYGNRIVAIMGPSAKYETANLQAIENLSWTASEKRAIKNQMDHMSSIVNYPGSYIIARYISFAFLDAVNNNANAVDAMKSYIGAINMEITRKRSEFDLWTTEETLVEKSPSQS